MVDSVKFRPVFDADVKEVLDLEVMSYPEDEAATLEKIAYRAKNASPFFIIGTGDLKGQKDRIVCFVNGTLATSGHLSHETMAEHEAFGRHLCIHSVCVHPDYRRKGLGTILMKRYLDKVLALKYPKAPSEPWVESILLIAHSNLVSFYANVGFMDKGRSDVEHGSNPWNEMQMIIKPPKPDFESETKKSEHKKHGHKEGEKKESPVMYFALLLGVVFVIMAVGYLLKSGETPLQPNPGKPL